MILPKTLSKLYRLGKVIDQNGQERIVDSTISEPEAVLIARVVADIAAVNTLETGLAFGASALAICGAKKDKGNSVHYGIDPNQSRSYGNVALALLKEADLLDKFVLLEGPSHLMMPGLIESKLNLDFAFIDGWHTFDYTLVDFFFIDKMLKKGGIVAFHDMYAPSKQKVLNFILTHRKYKIESSYRVNGNESTFFTLKFFLWRLFKKPQLLFSKYHWTYQLRNSSGLIFLRKVENFEPEFDFYKAF
jgi:predicted O-methyltransferase YrrM